MLASADGPLPHAPPSGAAPLYTASSPPLTPTPCRPCPTPTLQRHHLYQPPINPCRFGLTCATISSKLASECCRRHSFTSSSISPADARKTSRSFFIASPLAPIATPFCSLLRNLIFPLYFCGNCHLILRMVAQVSWENRGVAGLIQDCSILHHPP